MSEQPLCGYCMLPVAKGLPGIKHMGTSIAHPHVSMCLDATRSAARAWQALRDWLDKPTWQPIESAPRDGTIILVHPATWNGMTASPARWDDNRYAKKPRPYWNRIDTVSTHVSRERDPTHWMPMPREVPP